MNGLKLIYHLSQSEEFVCAINLSYYYYLQKNNAKSDEQIQRYIEGGPGQGKRRKMKDTKMRDFWKQ